MIVTGSANLVPITPTGPVRPMQIPVGSMPALPVPKTRVASAARVNKPAALAVSVHFPKNIPKGANTGITEVESSQMYTFPNKYPKYPVIMTYCEESDKKFFVKQAAGKDSDSDGSEDEDTSQVYQEIIRGLLVMWDTPNKARSA